MIFEIVKLVPFPEVQKTIHGEEARGGKIICPFHEERIPSFHIYEDGYKCFGCGMYGDSISFVSKFLNVRPIEAALIIAGEFSLLVDQSTSRQERIRNNVFKRSINTKELYHLLEEKAFHNLIKYREQVNCIVRNSWPDLDEPTIRKVHELPKVEENLRILSSGNKEERLTMLHEGEMEKWARLDISLKQIAK